MKEKKDEEWVGEGLSRELLPRELVRFLDISGGASLLVRGDPGSGKTIMSLTLLKEFSPENGVYISTRVDPKKIHQWYPWTKEFLESSRIVDATGNPLGSSEDFRVIDYVDKVSFVKNIYSMIREGADFIVVDSFSALELFADSENLATTLSEVSRRLDVKFVLVSEESKTTKLDYLVDGIVMLKKSHMGISIYREIILEKLRSVEIRKSKYPFTLLDGKFRILKPSSRITSSVRFNPEVTGEFIRSGNRAADEVLKLLSFGDFVLLELSEETNLKDIFWFIGALLHVFLNSDRSALIAPPEGIESSTISQLYIQLCGEEIEKRSPSLRIFETENPAVDQYKGNVIVALGDESDLRKISEAHLELRTLGKESLLILGFDLLEYLYGEEAIRKMIPQLNSRVKALGDILVAIGRENLRVKDALRNVADVHIKVFKVEDVLFLDILRPKDGLWSFTVDDSGVEVVRVV